MNKFFSFVSIVLLCALFTACSVVPPQTMMGFSDQEWESFNKEKKQRLLNNYHKVQEESSKNQESTTDNGENVLMVTLSSGEVMMPPFEQSSPYQKVSFELGEGSCRDQALLNPKGDKQILLKVCYKNKALHLDPSNYDPEKSEGTLTLYFSPLWKEGFIYHNINTTGYARLQKADLSIKKK
jgi:hypothetical protein